MNLRGEITTLRAVEPSDIDLIYFWENDTNVWRVSGTLLPFSRFILERFVDLQQQGIHQTGQQRFIIECGEGYENERCENERCENEGGTEPTERRAVGTIDLFEFDPHNLRAGVGILIYDGEDRGKGYAKDALNTLCRHCREHLYLHQLWCNVEVDNTASLELFKGAGFEIVGIKKGWNRCVGGYKDEIMMQCIL